MPKFHNYDPQERLDQAHERATTALNNTLQLAEVHNQQEAFLADLVNQHKNIVTIIKQIRLELEQLRQQINK